MRFLIFICIALVAPALLAANQPKYAYTGLPGVFYKSESDGCKDINAARLYAGTRTPTAFVNFYNRTCYFGTTDTYLSGGVQKPVIINYPSPAQVGFCSSGQAKTYTWPLGRRDSSAEFNIAPGTAISPPAFACIDGCRARHLSVSSCFNETETDGSITYCDYNAELTGESCNTSENQPPEVPQPTDPGDGGTDPGDGGTDPGDGGTDPGDGGTDPGDGGSPGDGGTNPGDGGTNPGDGGTNPGNGGTNPGNGGTNPGGGDSDGGSASGLACDQPLACSGDAIQCAILDTQKRARCDALAAGNYPSQEGDITGFINGKGDSAKLDEGDGEIDVSGLFSGPTDPRFLPATCPAAKTVTLTSQGGRTFEFTYEPLCQFATDLGYLIVIAASLFYAIYVGRASGGE